MTVDMDHTIGGVLNQPWLQQMCDICWAWSALSVIKQKPGIYDHGLVNSQMVNCSAGQLANPFATV